MHVVPLSEVPDFVVEEGPSWVGGQSLDYIGEQLAEVSLEQVLLRPGEVIIKLR